MAEAPDDASPIQPTITLDVEIFRPTLLHLVAFGPKGDAFPVGTAFIIGAFGDMALCVTAAHVLTGVRQAQFPYSRAHPSCPPQFAPPAPALSVDVRKFRALYTLDRNVADMCEILEYREQQEIDLAMLLIRSQGGIKKNLFEWKLPLDSLDPVSCEQLLAIGFDEMSADVTHISAQAKKVVYSSRIGARQGQVTRSGMVLDQHQGPVFEMDTDVGPGMSGGPILRLMPSGQISVCGVIRSGLQVGQDDEVRPASIGTMVWPLYSWQFPIRVNGVDAPSVRDLIRLGHVQDHSAEIIRTDFNDPGNGKINLFRTWIGPGVPAQGAAGRQE